MDIKASDLRIGNLIHEEVLGNCKVFEILNHVIVVVVNSLEADGSLRKMFYTLNYSCVKPIPLTKELLLRFGFVKYGKLHDSYKLNPFIIELGILGDKYNFRKIINKEESILLKEMKYVHELQNIYHVLKNKELELKNPPVKYQEG